MVKIATECVRKIFKIGDFVEVTSAQDAELQGFVVGVEPSNGAGDKVTIMKHGCQDQVSGLTSPLVLYSYFRQFSSNSSILHLRDPPSQLYSTGRTILTPDEALLMRTVPRRNPNRPRYHQRLWQGMPVLVLNKLAKGLQGELRYIHEEYKLDESNKTRTNSQGMQEYATGHQCAADCQSCIVGVRGGHICSAKCERCRLIDTEFKIDKAQQSTPYMGPTEHATKHQCIGKCRSCVTGVQEGHVCSDKCERCRLDKMPHFEEEGLGYDDLKAVFVDVYIPARSTIQKFDIMDVRPAT